MTQTERRTALELARGTIRCHLSGDPLPKVPTEGIFGQNGAVFVTLHTKDDHQLRGCIGTILAYRPLGEDISAHAIDAAVNDPRFVAMSLDELENVEIEISVLSEPKPLAYDTADELLDALRVDVDGVVIRYDGYGATFLPSVWEQLPDKSLFLSHLCQKAGLPHDFWQSGKLEVQLYQSELFSEDQ